MVSSLLRLVDEASREVILLLGTREQGADSLSLLTPQLTLQGISPTERQPGQLSEHWLLSLQTSAAWEWEHIDL